MQVVQGGGELGAAMIGSEAAGARPGQSVFHRKRRNRSADRGGVRQGPDSFGAGAGWESRDDRAG